MLASSIFSIGYGNRKVDRFLDLLIENKISIVVDIRSKPYSRFQPVYNKSRLAQVLQEVGISYLFKGEGLGGKPKNEMLYTNGRLNYGLVIATREYQNAISELIQIVSTGERACLLCCELNPDTCHRKNLVAESLRMKGIPVNHIIADGKVEVHSSLSPLF
jgi:uncharacterized protein (DUF488 family)